MKTFTMLEFRKDAAGILRRIAKGERFVLSHRGRPAALLDKAIGSEQRPFSGYRSQSDLES
jgi:antitoxin (DNA-binding transcriptional repressor) of toxin-antitoxin stability system